jgi:hypothetical protein
MWQTIQSSMTCQYDLPKRFAVTHAATAGNPNFHLCNHSIESGVPVLFGPKYMAELLSEYGQDGKFPAQSCHPYNRPQTKLTLDLTHGEIPPKLSQHVTGQV